jgi:Bacterial Ig domain
MVIFRNDTRLSRKLFTIFAKSTYTLLLFVSAILINSLQVGAEPFNCSNKFYQVINGVLSELNPDTGQYITIGTTGSMLTNASGYNIEDQYIYAWQRVDPFAQGVNGLVRIHSNGTSEFLGVPMSTDPNSGFVAGDFDRSGNLYLYDGSNNIYKIDISTLSTEIIPLSQPISANDLVFNDGFLYSVTSTSLFSINIDNGQVATSGLSIPLDPTNPTTVYGAGWTSNDGKLFFSRNSDGKIFQIENYQTSSPNHLLVLDGAPSQGNDGASCPLAESPLTPISAFDNSNSTSQNTILNVSAQQGVLVNDFGRAINVTSHTQPQNGSLVINSDGSYTYTPNQSFIGLDSSSYTISDEFGQEKTAKLIISVNGIESVKPPKTGLSSESALIFVFSLIVVTLIGAGIYLGNNIITSRNKTI